MRAQNLNTVLEGIQKQYTKILGYNLVGIYVHGSIAFNCFNWEKSDIDYIVVVNEPLSLDVKKKLMEATVLFNIQAPQKGIEMSVVLKENCQNFVHPSPFEIHFSIAHLKWWHEDPIGYCKKMNGSDADLAAHYTVIRHKGIVLCGEEISSVFSEIDPGYYFDSIKSDIQDSKEDVFTEPVYIILNLCRVLAYKKDGSILSKCEGGEWGLLNLPCEYRAIVEQALENYLASSNDKIVLNDIVATQFCDYMLKMIF